MTKEIEAAQVPVEATGPVEEYENQDVEAPVEEADQEEEKDKVDDAEEHFTSVSNIKPSKSMISKMSSKTYISALHKQLEEEKQARARLENEMADLRKFSEEINSNLEEIKKSVPAKSQAGASNA